jgi:hypothetical protein
MEGTLDLSGVAQNDLIVLARQFARAAAGVRNDPSSRCPSLQCP